MVKMQSSKHIKFYWGEVQKRGFKVAQGFEQSDINLPTRATNGAAGYDFEAAEDTYIPSIWKEMFLYFFPSKASADHVFTVKPTLVKTGIKSYMKKDEYLQLANRSSNPLKRALVLANGIGIIDSDYYNNEDNDGHIMFQFWNFGFSTVLIKKGERIGQGTFIPFLKADYDNSNQVREGGFGSSGK